MNPKEQWIAALRSGDYKQGFHRLRRDYEFCCLGVACDLAVKAGLPIEVTTVGDGGTAYDGSDGCLPYSVADWLGVTHAAGCYDGGALTGDNDNRGHSFAQIANTIETHPEMFVEHA